MTSRQGPAAAEEQAELRMLRDRADLAGREVSETVVALAGKLSEAASPRAWARRKAAGVRAAAGQITGKATGILRRPAGVGRARLAAAGATAGVLVIVAVAVRWQHGRYSLSRTGSGGRPTRKF